MRVKLKEERLRKWKKTARFAVAIIIIFLAVFLRIQVPRYFQNLKFFTIKEVAVEPYRYKNLIDTYIKPGSENLLFFDMASLYAAIREIYFIEDCTIEKQLPDVLSVRLKIRTPWVLVVSADKTVPIDHLGYFLPFQENFNGWKITGLKPGAVGSVSSEPEKIKVLSEIERWYNYYDLALKFPVETVAVEDMDKICLSGPKGTVFVYPGNLEEKFEKLRIALEQCEKENFPFEYIDLRFDQPYVKKKEEVKGQVNKKP